MLLAVRIVRVPTNVLIPLSAVFSIAGTYAVKLLMFDVVLMLSFAALGILLHRFGYLLIAVVLGIVLVPILDAELLRTYQAYRSIDLSVFVNRPVSFVMLLLLGFSLLTAVLQVIRQRRQPVTP